MKLFLLCLGFYLTIFLNAKAQDSTQIALPDSTQTTLTDSSLPGHLLQNRQIDSLRTLDSLADMGTDSIGISTHANSGPARSSGAALPPEGAEEQKAAFSIESALNSAAQDPIKTSGSNQISIKNSQEKDNTVKTDRATAQLPVPAPVQDTIVDIFEEMRKAKQQQDLSIEAQARATAASEKKAAEDKNTSSKTAGMASPTDAPAGIDQQKIAEPGTVISEDNSPKANSTFPPVNSKSPATADSSVLLRDTIQSIFTLPKSSANTEPTTGQNSSTSDSLPEDSNAPEAVTLPRPLSDTSKPARDKTGDSTRTTDTQKEKTAIFDSTSAAAVSPVSVAGNRTPDSTHPDTLRISADTINGSKAVQKAKIESIFTSVDEAHTRQVDSSNHGSRLQDSSHAAGTTQQSREGSQKENSTSAQIPVQAEATTPAINPSKKLDSARSSLTSEINARQKDRLENGTPFIRLFQPYQKFDKNTSIESTTNLTILQQKVDYKTKADFTTQYQRTGMEASQFLFDVSVVKLNTEVETMGVQLKYDSNQKEDTSSTFARPLFDIVGKRTYLKVDSTGKITGVDTTRLGQKVNTVLSGLSLSGGDFEAGSNFGLLLNREMDGLQLGQTWQDSIRQGNNQQVTTYKIQNILNDELIVIISGTVTQTGEIVSDGALFKTHFTGTQNGKMRVDKNTRLIKSKEITLTMKGTVDYNDNQLPASAVSKIKETVTEE